MWVTWVLTVVSLMYSCSPISALDRPAGAERPHSPPDPGRWPGWWARCRSDRRIADRPARRHDRARASPGRLCPRPRRRPSSGHARRRDPNPCHRRRHLLPGPGVRRCPARARARRRPPDQPAARNDPGRVGPSGHREGALAGPESAVSRPADQRSFIVHHRSRRRSRE